MTYLVTRHPINAWAWRKIRSLSDSFFVRYIVCMYITMFPASRITSSAKLSSPTHLSSIDLFILCQPDEQARKEVKEKAMNHMHMPGTKEETPSQII
jgi:hypothetical protein